MTALTRSCLCLIGLAVALAGCGGGPTTDTLEEAVAATRAVGAHELAMRGTTYAGVPSTLSTFTAEGQVDLADGAYRYTVEDSQVAGLSYSAEVVAPTDDNVYVQGLPGTDEGQWLRVEDAPDAVTADLPTFINPDAVLGLVEGLTGPVTDLGEEDLDGVTVQQLRLVLPPGRVQRLIQANLELLGSDMVQAVADVGDIVAQATAQLWIDDDRVIRQIRVEYRVTVGSDQAIPGVGALDNDVQVTLQPRGEPVGIQPPDGDVARLDYTTLFQTPTGPPSQ